MRIVASLTTIPSRIEHIRPVLDSLLAQSVPIEHIELNLPYVCVRTNEPYILPGWLESLDEVQIYRTEDYGPITKVAQTLIRYKDDHQTHIWSVDDDYSYPSNQLELLLHCYDPGVCRILTRHGGIISAEGDVTFLYGETKVSMFEGFGTVLYPPDCIGEDFMHYVQKTSEDMDCRVSDDLVLSHYFNARGIPIFLCNTPSETVPFYPTGALSHAAEDALGHQSGGHIQRYKRVYALLTSSWPPKK